MKDDTFDPRYEMMIASLYGELEEEGEARFQAMLEEDAALRAEWEELRSTRSLLQGWEMTEKSPRFVVMPAEEASRAAADATGRRHREPGLEGPGAVPAGAGSTGSTDPGPGGVSGGPGRGGERPWWGGAGREGGLRERLRRYLVPSAWGFAFAAFVLALLALADFRIELIENGVGLRFGPPASPPAAQRGTGAGAGVDSLTLHPGLLSMLGPLPGSSAEPGSYVTREEFQQYAVRTAHVLSEMARTYEADQTDARDVAGFMQAMYRSLDDQQREQYYDLRGHIEAVKVGLHEVRTSTNDRLEGLFENNPGEPLVPQYPVPSPFGSQKGFEDDQ